MGVLSGALGWALPAQSRQMSCSGDKYLSRLAEAEALHSPGQQCFKMSETRPARASQSTRGFEHELPVSGTSQATYFVTTVR